MANQKLRQQIVFEAARLIYKRQEADYRQAKMKAARKLCRGWVKATDLPSNYEIRDEIQRLTHLYEGERRFDKLREMRIQALRIMRLLRKWNPRLIGSTLSGQVRQGSDIDLHVFSSSVNAVMHTLEDAGMRCNLERKRLRRAGEERISTRIHIHDRFAIELTFYDSRTVRHVFKNSITGKATERASIAELEQLLRQEYPDLPLDDESIETTGQIDRFEVYRSLLVPLESVQQSRQHHPEGDVLYHSLQVFDHACDELPYDEEFLLAALLHDVGKAIDPGGHVAAGLEALLGFVTDRTAWFIEHHAQAHDSIDGNLGVRARRRLQQSADYDALMSLAKCDRAGRLVSARVPELDEALDYIRNLERLYG